MGMHALIVLATFAFPGGSTADLAKAAADASTLPIAILESDREKERAAEFNWETGVDFRREMRSYFQFSAIDLESSGFGTNAWPTWMVKGERIEPAPGQFREADGKLTADPKDWISAKNAAVAAGLGDSHWFLGNARLAVAAKDLPKADLARVVRGAVGAQPEADGLQPIWRWLRMRSANAYANWSKEPDEAPVPVGSAAAVTTEFRVAAGIRGVSTATTVQGMPVTATTKEMAKFAGQAIATLTDKQTEALYESQGARLSIAARPRTPLHNAAWALLRASVQKNAAMAQRFQQARQPIVDQSLPVQIELKPIGLPSVVFPSPSGRSGVTLLAAPQVQVFQGRPRGRGGRVPPPR